MKNHYYTVEPYSHPKLRTRSQKEARKYGREIDCSNFYTHFSDGTWKHGLWVASAQGKDV